ncbi:hypothetical protein BP5796_06195 [Coleophoma crateriformis]|uniref:rRNA adenine N(6)-methyltransferase n=1 Tax=Coleophoma crateriformis TaxID=565419 RepID=A0A3D8RWB1_9HELO|nr:hypothetical protein BP5796_06195 [Coleophoma crateriformis]
MLHSLTHPARSALLRSASSRFLYSTRTFHSISSQRLPAASAKPQCRPDSGGGSAKVDALPQEDAAGAESEPKRRVRKSISKTTVKKADSGDDGIPASTSKRQRQKRKEELSPLVEKEVNSLKIKSTRRARKSTSATPQKIIQDKDKDPISANKSATKIRRRTPTVNGEIPEGEVLSEEGIPVTSALRRPKHATPKKLKISQAKPATAKLRGTPIADYLVRAHMTRHNADTEKTRNADRYPKPLDGTRVDITNEALINSIMDRLKPSLQRHIGCDIVEMNPGAGVFSSKLHDVLSPRTHVLLEADPVLYEKECLRPLLDAEGSTYKLLPENGMLWDNIEKAFSKEFLPHQEKFDKDDPRRFQPNNTLLFVANLGYTVPKRFGRIPNFTKLFVHQLLGHIRARTMFQQYGLVRMLLWVADHEKVHVLPRTIMDRRSFAVDAEISCSDIFEVASADSSASSRKRALAADLESTLSVIERMENSKVLPVEGRQSLAEIEARKGLQSKPENGVAPPKRDFYLELEKMEARYAAGGFPKFVDDINTPLELRKPEAERARGTTSRDFQTAEYVRLCYLRHRVNKEAKRSSSIDQLVLDWEGIVGMKDEISRLEGDAAITAQQSLEQRQRKWQYEYDHKSDNDQAMFWNVYEDRVAIRQSPSLLAWDRREAEPIITKEMDFVPAQPLALLDFHPQPPWPVLRSKGQLDAFDFIQPLLWTLPTQSVKRALQSMAHGAYDWIVPECPSLTDPAKGGARDLDELKVRCLTQQQLKEIMESWVRWPFRPSRAQLLLRSGGSLHHVDSPNTEDDDWWEPK